MSFEAADGNEVSNNNARSASPVKSAAGSLPAPTQAAVPRGISGGRGGRKVTRTTYAKAWPKECRAIAGEGGSGRPPSTQRPNLAKTPELTLEPKR